MGSFVWMKVLESTPERYDRGIKMLMGGVIEEVYTYIAETVAGPKKRVLDLGCGTGAVTLACAARGADVIGVDIDAGMLEVARGKPVPQVGHVTWIQASAAEIEDHVEEECLDAVVCCLSMSELSPDEQDYALRTARSRLVDGGRMMIVDEVEPTGWAARLAYKARRMPRALATYLLTQTTTRPMDDMAGRMREAGFADVEETRPWTRSLVCLQGYRRDTET